MYVERYVGPDAGEKELSRDTAEGLKGLIEVALEITKLKEFLRRDEPTVITVGPCRPCRRITDSRRGLVSSLYWKGMGVSSWAPDLYDVDGATIEFRFSSCGVSVFSSPTSHQTDGYEYQI